MNTIKQVDAHFSDGAESVTLTAAEWKDIWEISRGYFATGRDLDRAKEEIARIKRIATPLWRACKAVSRQMRACGLIASKARTQQWEIRLRHATQVDWRDQPLERRVGPKR